MTLIVNSGEYEFARFENAVDVLAEEFGYEGLAWDMVVASGDMEILTDFLNGNGLLGVIED